MSSRGDAENEDEVGLLRRKLRQVAIDRRIAGGKDVRADDGVCKGGAPAARQRPDQDRAGIERHPWKRLEPGKNDPHRSAPEQGGDLFDRGVGGKAPGRYLGFDARQHGLERTVRT